MASRLAWPLLPVFFSVAVCSCTPSGDRVKEEMETKSFCTFDDYKMQGDPRKDKQGYIHYRFSAMIQCKDQRGFYSRKFPSRTRITGEAEMKGLWFGFRHVLSRYELNPDEEEAPRKTTKRSGKKPAKEPEEDEEEEEEEE